MYMPGRGDEVKGSIKEAAGKVTGNERLQAEGKADQAKGKAARETAGAANQVAGNVKKGTGKVLGNEQMKAEGTAQNLKGRGQSAG